MSESRAPHARLMGMKPLSVVFTLCAVAAAAALVDVPTASAGDTKCGKKGQPMCPLQGWMENNVSPAHDDQKLPELEKLLGQIAGFAPDPKWNEGDKSWKKIAEDGAAKAKAGDFKGAQKSCKSCHKAWRKKYRAEHRTRPVPK